MHQTMHHKLKLIFVNNQPILSLIIPTRERARTLPFTLTTALEQVSTDFEVIVSDNASSDDTRVVVERIFDKRLRYFNTGKRLSMCGNYEFALEKACGKYILIIGDDDAVIPGALDYLLSCLRAEPDLTIHMWPLHIYDWPVGERQAQIAYLAPVQSRSELDLKAKARLVNKLGAWKYYELPSPYHCAIPKYILDSIRERTGRVFHSTQPDVFTAMAIPAYADRAVNLGRTITLNGRSAQSNGLGFVKRSALSNIERFIQEYGDYEFYPTLFDGVSAPANMIPDAVLLAHDMFPELYEDVTFDYGAMWAYVCRLGFVSHIEVFKKRQAIRRIHPFSMLKFLSFSMIHEMSVIRRKILNRMTFLGSLKDDTPDNIRDFARVLARNQKQGLP